jgi:hypothetical protein
MPAFTGLLRRKGASSDLDIRRHSFYATESRSNPTVADARASEQIPRRPSPAEFLSPSDPLHLPSTPSRLSADNADPATRSVSPPVQEESTKHRRFSMLKFRHASDSQLSTRARLESNNPPPPMPHLEVPKREQLHNPICKPS